MFVDLSLLHSCVVYLCWFHVIECLCANKCVQTKDVSWCTWPCVCNVYLWVRIGASSCICLKARTCALSFASLCVCVCTVTVPLCVCSVCMYVYVSACSGPAAACVTLVNIKAALYFAELTNLSHPWPRAAFETHTASLGSALWTLNLFLPRPPCSSLYQIIL